MEQRGLDERLERHDEQPGQHDEQHGELQGRHGELQELRGEPLGRHDALARHELQLRAHVLNGGGW